ncbi:MAG TPA: enoyl-CoA hydratase-related protein [Acidimicrobiia bacterium]|nr:enoyl-CoA hydratase-related protein [Acidimicrobiia bacterium]
MSVDYVLDGDVALVTLNRPDRYNAIDASLGEGLATAMSRAGAESRAVILTGAGKAFCSGADLQDLKAEYEQGSGPDLAALLEDVFHPALESILDCEVPVIGAINGVAAGAGLGVALACDLRVMSETAFLTSAFTAIGLVPDTGTTWWLSHHLGVSRALELTLTNRRVGAGEARELGLCLDVVPEQELLDRAGKLASELADLVPDALVSTRRLVRDASGSSLDRALRAEQREQGRLGKTPEHREGVMAFMEKRRPHFRSP